jgi:hypothetical protein
MLRALSSDLWITERPLRFGGVELGARMSAVRLRDGGLFLHSPVALDAELRSELAALGTPRFAVAPNRLHHLFIGAYREAFPGIQLFAAPGLPEKRRDLVFDAVLGDDPAPGWAGEIDQAFVGGYPMLNEVAFCDRRSRTLLTCDLVFNVGPGAPWLTKAAFIAVGGYGFGPTLLERLAIRDRTIARRAFEKILSWDFDRVVMAHGDVLERGGREAMRSAYGWLLNVNRN